MSKTGLIKINIKKNLRNNEFSLHYFLLSIIALINIYFPLGVLFKGQ